MFESQAVDRLGQLARRLARGVSPRAKIGVRVFLVGMLCLPAAPAVAAPILLAEFSVRDVVVRGGSIPATVPFRFRAYEPFPLVYFSWEDNYRPADVGKTFLAPPEVVMGADDAIRSPTATYDLTIASISFSQWQLTNPSCDINRCLQVFVTNPSGHTITSVERIIDQLALTGNPPGEQYVVDAKERIRLWGEPIPEPQTLILLAIGVSFAFISFTIRHRYRCNVDIVINSVQTIDGSSTLLMPQTTQLSKMA